MQGKNRQIRAFFHGARGIWRDAKNYPPRGEFSYFLLEKGGICDIMVRIKGGGLLPGGTGVFPGAYSWKDYQYYYGFPGAENSEWAGRLGMGEEL